MCIRLSPKKLHLCTPFPPDVPSGRSIHYHYVPLVAASHLCIRCTSAGPGTSPQARQLLHARLASCLAVEVNHQAVDLNSITKRRGRTRRPDCASVSPFSPGRLSPGAQLLTARRWNVNICVPSVWSSTRLLPETRARRVLGDSETHRASWQLDELLRTRVGNFKLAFRQCDCHSLHKSLFESTPCWLC